MDDDAIAAFNAFPNGCIILDRTGQIAARQKWAEPDAIHRALDDILAKPTTRLAAE
jgi:hypothetical protein